MFCLADPDPCQGRRNQSKNWIQISLEKNYYCLSKKSCPIPYSNLLYKMGQDILEIQYNTI